ncbi:hypothetical protein E2C01_047398 [Portunus trituberculatus]|uniref:Uncharacterized protein n=1 Tax=Portunus trituberculatus TaxID=210409 RepID=A0A5B7GAD5_PORTR|nr:hypothetical protein [Portunus trituberculatus]
MQQGLASLPVMDQTTMANTQVPGLTAE